MIKKTALLSLIASTLLFGDISQKGFFVGADLSQNSAVVAYDNNANGSSTSITVRPYDNSYSKTIPSFKVGYQYYYTRVYARYSSFDYSDNEREKFSIKGSIYEMNADYVPLMYISKNKSWDIRGVVGFGVGYNDSSLNVKDIGLLPAGESINGSQQYMQYGYQLGLMCETSSGISIEMAYRVRYGNLQEFTDGANQSTFDLETQEFYLGVNYLF